MQQYSKTQTGEDIKKKMTVEHKACLCLPNGMEHLNLNHDVEQLHY